MQDHTLAGVDREAGWKSDSVRDKAIRLFQYLSALAELCKEGARRNVLRGTVLVQ